MFSEVWSFKIYFSYIPQNPFSLKWELWHVKYQLCKVATSLSYFWYFCRWNGYVLKTQSNTLIVKGKKKPLLFRKILVESRLQPEWLIQKYSICLTLNSTSLVALDIFICFITIIFLLTILWHRNVRKTIQTSIS